MTNLVNSTSLENETNPETNKSLAAQWLRDANATLDMGTHTIDDPIIEELGWNIVYDEAKTALVAAFQMRRLVFAQQTLQKTGVAVDIITEQIETIRLFGQYPPQSGYTPL